MMNPEGAGGGTEDGENYWAANWERKELGRFGWLAASAAAAGHIII
jgi:hypothetical protein